jgi:hypothetical protein
MACALARFGSPVQPAAATRKRHRTRTLYPFGSVAVPFGGKRLLAESNTRVSLAASFCLPGFLASDDDKKRKVLSLSFDRELEKS